MKVDIIYSSVTGHSKKIASAIADKLNVTAYDIKENPAIENCDLMYIVSGIYGGNCSPKLLEFVQKLSPQQVKKVALLTSSTKMMPQNTVRDTLVSNGIDVLTEEYLCKGSFLFLACSHPNRDDITGAVKFAEKFVQE